MADTRKPDRGRDADVTEQTQAYGEVPDLGRPAGERTPGIGIEVVGGPMDGQHILAEGSVVTIGRSDGNDLSLALDSTVSTRHARIVREGDHFWLEDLGSTNGTFLGDKRIKERTLIGPGTLFTIGCTRLEFSPR